MLWSTRKGASIRTSLKLLVVTLLFIALHNQPPQKTNASENLNKQDSQHTSLKTKLVGKLKPKTKAKPEVRKPSRAKAPSVRRTSAAPKRVSYPRGCGHYVALVNKYDWNAQVAINIIRAESSCIPTRVNNNPGTGDYSVGLFQVNLYGRLRLTRPSEAWLKIPSNNVAYAYQLYKANGWSPWGFTTCRYKVSCY